MLKNTKDKEKVIVKTHDQYFFSEKIINFQITNIIVLFKQMQYKYQVNSNY